MTRIVAGVAGSRRLRTPAGRTTRPTSERVREALFATLESLRGTPGLTGARVLDLYAGSGAVGLEALSRGAASALLVESEPRALAALRANVAALGLLDAVVRAVPVERLAQRVHTGVPFDIVFADPPYLLPAARLDAVLGQLAGRGWLADGALVVLERAAGDPAPHWPAGVVALARRRYGDSALWYGRARRTAEPTGA